MSLERRYPGAARIVYYEKGDAAYIYLRPIERTEHTLPDHVDLDFDHDGRLVGIGLDQDAASRLPAELLANAERV